MSDYNPAELTTASDSIESETYAEDHGDEASMEDRARPSEREGLPSGYRMRAEDHYVDELLSRRRASRADEDDDQVSQPTRASGDALSRGRAEPVSVDLDGERQARILAQVSEEIAAIESAAGLLAESGAGLYRRVGADLIRVQVRRAAWMLRAQALAAGTHTSALRQKAMGALLADVRDGLAAECRLAGVALHLQATDQQATVTIDDETVVTGITAAVRATLALVGHQEGAAVRVTAVALGGDLRTVEVRQDTVPVGGPDHRRFFDPSWTDRPGGWLAAFAADTARAVARLSGGEATFLVRERRGSTIRLTFSRLG